MLVAVLLTAAVASATQWTPRAPLPWNDWNFIATTDLHGYIAGHGTADGSKYTANVADVAIWVDEMRRQATAKNVELFVVDSGDWHDGTAYSDKTNPDGVFTDPLLSEIDYDVLGIGNHELYNNGNSIQTHDVVAKKFDGKFLTGNIFWKNADGSIVDFSKKVRKFTGSKGTKVTAFSFLFNGFIAPKGTATNVIQTNVTDAVQQQWFTAALVEKPDFFLLVGHIALRGNYVQTPAPEWTTAINAIRKVHPTVPIVVFGGHYHVRDFIVFPNDTSAYGLASGRYLETIGWMSLSKSGVKSSVDRRYLDANVATLNYHLGRDETAALGTSNEKGKKMNSLIADAGKATNASVVLGYAPHDFYLSRVNASDEYSTAWLWEKYMSKTYQKPNANPAYFVSNAGTLRSDIFEGPFTIDNAFQCLPFANPLYVIEGLDFSVISQFKAWFNKYNKHTRRQAPCTGTPGYVTLDDLSSVSQGDDTVHCSVPYVANTAKGLYSPRDLPSTDDKKWDLVFVSFVADDVVAALTALGVKNVPTSNWKSYIPGKFSNDFLPDMAVKFWQNFPTTATASASGPANTATGSASASATGTASASVSVVTAQPTVTYVAASPAPATYVAPSPAGNLYKASAKAMSVAAAAVFAAVLMF